MELQVGDVVQLACVLLTIDTNIAVLCTCTVCLAAAQPGRRADGHRDARYSRLGRVPLLNSSPALGHVRALCQPVRVRTHSSLRSCVL